MLNWQQKLQEEAQRVRYRDEAYRQFGSAFANFGQDINRNKIAASINRYKNSWT